MNLHQPVMLPEVLRALAPVTGERYIDATFGAGGYTGGILAATECTVDAIDRDKTALALGKDLLQKYGARLKLHEGPYSEMERLVGGLVDGVVLDIGVSSMQLDQPERGFSFMKDGPLDMRMGGDGETAADIVNVWPGDQLADLIWELGEDRASRRIAAAIVRRREEKKFERTLDLAEVVADAVGRGGKIHPATRTFQALRIAVNDELTELSAALHAAERMLKPGGRLVVVSFHSLEDRLIKRFMAVRAGKTRGVSRHAPPPQAGRTPSFQMMTAHVQTPSVQELGVNPRARSAKMRAAKRTSAAAWNIVPEYNEAFA
jgi:16S rRNA (cytosine1402-N4)-methyltransferase